MQLISTTLQTPGALMARDRALLHVPLHPSEYWTRYGISPGKWDTALHEKAIVLTTENKPSLSIYLFRILSVKLQEVTSVE